MPFSVESQVVNETTPNGEQTLLENNNHISQRSKTLFIIAGVILVGMWLLTFISGFVV